MFKKISFVVVIALSVLGCVIDASALTIGPARLEVRLPAGEVAGIDYYAQNDTGSPIHVIIEPENWFQGSYDYKGLNAGDWIKTEPREFDLKPKEIKKILVTVRVPKKAKGELVGQIFFTSIMAGSSDDKGGSMRSRLGGVLYVAIRDTEKASAEIRNIDISSSATDKKEELKIGIILHNSGNVHIRPAEGTVVVSDEKGREINRLPFVTDYSVVPGQKFTYSALWENPALKEGRYCVSASIKYGKMYGKEKTTKFEKAFEVDKDGKVSVK